ncbi:MULTISPECIES: DUF1569 domain-containing protein [Robiginitalea]|uniref:DUF1569 domain-containing protein n=1 Tax=Robiginitalea biformata (strain ATCC BAA-864 / DSM 15991 / KCTC 12146 / HTCC2501) TaxID=313596 RepID=A4CJS5_ROBBH|nr:MULTISPECIES: DUF1569 domain-containing protein [Robiginitalea]EAR17183.1 hypothetical protein RB2501_09775 [Robiginitalea biformata HTCC2501]MDC6355523.1 DUF1569 domain-containing protein [Robiginitalea sp. PM2]MDC6375867.1 DUF1569 domain-containing protein [Robiginitalea sp. SP8]
MKSLFDPEAHREIKSRLKQLRADDKPAWGRMSAGQMVWHCQFPLKIAIKNKDVRMRTNPLLLWFFKKSLYNDRLWRKNLPTAPGAKATEPRDFDAEFPVLIDLVDACHALKDRKVWNPHPMFGELTPEQWGKMQYKHLDHHLRQFGK